MRSLAFRTAFVALLMIAACYSFAVGQKHRPPIRQTPPKQVGAKVVTNCPGSGLTDAEVADLLTGHNKQRQKVNTPPLRWDCTLGAIAASWAKHGVPGHSGTDFG